MLVRRDATILTVGAILPHSFVMPCRLGGVASSIWLHLFDHHRLTEAEWQVLEEQLGTLMESAHLYALQVRLVALQRWWGRGAPA